MPKRNASGAGSIRQRPDGRWEGRITVGRDPGTGKQLRRSIYGDSQSEVVKEIQRLQTEREGGTYVEPSKMTVAAWLDVWEKEYLGGVKQSTQASYKGHIKNHLKPALGAVALQRLRPHQIQNFYNGLQADGLSSKTVRNIHGILHTALQQAAKNGYVKSNPSDMCTLPRWTKKEMQVMDDHTMAAFLQAIEGDPHEAALFVCLFTGMRQSELLGLCWDAVDFKAGTLTVSRQLLRERKEGGAYYLDTTKNDKVRRIKPAAFVMDKLKERKLRQTEDQLKAGPLWANPWGLVFTNETGGHLVHLTVYRRYKAIVAQIGQSSLRFHDMRHSFAVASLRAGDDLKVLQENLGHHSPAFTLGTYAHVTQSMQDESADRMQQFIQKVKEKKA